jgi:probable HAF family extracellular repeat protein
MLAIRICAARASHCVRGVFLRATLATGICLWSLSAAHAALVYHLTDLGDLPGGVDESQARAINDRRQVVGYSIAATGGRAFLWTRDSGMQDLGDLPGGSNFSSASDISSLGHVVGRSGAPGGFGRAFLWTPEGGMQNLGDLPGGYRSVAHGVNDHGQVVGESEAATGLHAFLWTSANGMIDIGDLPGGPQYSRAMDINNLGQVAGGSFGLGASERAFLWTSQAGMRTLTDGAGYGINEVGQVAGGSSTLNAFLWSSAGGASSLGRGSALDVNDHGHVVGNTIIAAQQRPFLWTPADGLQDLHNLVDASASGWTLREANGINNLGQIVGFGVNPSGATHGFVLTPVPEPSALATFLIGMPVLFSGCWRRRPAE